MIRRFCKTTQICKLPQLSSFKAPSYKHHCTLYFVQNKHLQPWGISRQSFYISTEDLLKKASVAAEDLEFQKAKMKQAAKKLEEATNKVGSQIAKTKNFFDKIVNKFKQIVAALVCLITGINEFLHSTLNAELKKIKESIRKEQQSSQGSKVQKRIDNIMKKQKVDPQICQIPFHFVQPLFDLFEKSNQNNVILIQSPKDNYLSTYCKSFIQKCDQQNKLQDEGKNGKKHKSQLNKYDEYRYVDLKRLAFFSQNGNEVVQQFALYLKKIESSMIQKKKNLLLVIDSIELVDLLTKKKGQLQKVNVQKLAKVLYSIQRSKVFSLALISYDPYFFQNYFFSNKHFKNYNLLFDTFDQLKKQDIKKLIKKKIQLDFPKFTDFVSERHNNESQVEKILNFCKIQKKQSSLLKKKQQLQLLLQNKGKGEAVNLLNQQIANEQQLVLKKAEKVSSQILNERKRIIERSINKIYADLHNEQLYQRQVKIIDAKRNLLKEATTKGQVGINYLNNLPKEESKLYFLALKELNQEEILFRNSFTSLSIKKGVESCLAEYMKQGKK